MASFGKRGQDTQRSSNAVRPLAGSSPRISPQKPSPHVIYRDGETERPQFHGSFIDLHWPKLGASAAALFAFGYSISSGRTDPFSLVLVTALAGGMVYFVLNKFRKSVDDVHTARTEIFRSPRFAVGALLGLCYFVYSTFFGSSESTGNQIADAVAKFQDPLTPFHDGFQQQDLSAVAMLILKAAGMMVFGGLIVRTVARRVLGEEESGSTT
ncbi:hypothetical protein [Mesorhizobium amorphae]|uniref:hypothetical protein n=1 Tax=Mesorhizobium amorphae TaxID=71433 RepID=UPI001184630D|nr:hypothetical protein [Mesorhizobium amorphae]